MTVSKGRAKKDRSKKIRRWIQFSILYAIFYGILTGTLTAYFSSIHLFWIFWIDMPWTFTILALSGWSLLTYLLLKEPIELDTNI